MQRQINVTRSFMPPIEEYIEEIKHIWDSRWLTNMGTYHNQLEEALASFLQVAHLSLFANGHMALELVLQTMHLTGEVITTPYTFASTTHAIVRNGLTPVFCDVREEDCTIDINQLEKLITDKTTAILPVHVYGNVCRVEEIQNIACKYGLKVIYDAAHAFGITYKGNGIGSYGDASMFSFHATKVFHTIEGGAVSFRESSVGEELYRLKNFGIRSEEIVDGVGSNAKMNEFQAAMGICNLKYIKLEIEKRKSVVGQYRKRLGGVEGIQIAKEQEGVISNYAYFPVIIDEKLFGATRNEIYDKLREHQIYSRKYFYPITNTFSCFHGKYDVNQTPVALYLSKRVLALPLYADLGEEDIERVCNIILSLKKKVLF